MDAIFYKQWPHLSLVQDDRSASCDDIGNSVIERAFYAAKSEVGAELVRCNVDMKDSNAILAVYMAQWWFNTLNGDERSEVSPAVLQKCIDFNIEEMKDWCTEACEQQIIRNSTLSPFRECKFSPVWNFLKPTELLLSLGGDDRLTVSFSKKVKVNKYLSSTIPRPDMVRRGSCTCSTTTLDSYASANKARAGFLAEIIKASAAAKGSEDVHREIIKVFDRLQQANIERLKKVLGFNSTSEDASAHQVVLFPSGSDAEFLPLFVGFIRSFRLNSSASTDHVKVFNYVTAAGEVGSGTPAAAGGRHFSALAPDGGKQGNGDLLSGMDAARVEVVQFKPRDDNGATCLQEKAIEERVHADLSSNPRSVGIMHVVCGSKTGLMYPSKEVIDSMKKAFGDRLLIAMDACQLRCKLQCIEEYASSGCMSLITGSKFFTGAPFSGAVVLPSTIVAEIEDYITTDANAPLLPGGLRSYLTPYEIPYGMPQLRKILKCKNESDQWINLGLYLRWTSALDVMERYSALSERLVKWYTCSWVKRVKELVRQQAPHLILMTDEDESGGTLSDMIGEVSGIVSVAVAVRDGKSTGGHPALRFLNADELKVYHKLMTQSLTGAGASVDEVQCMLGQPVKLAKNGFAVVRIALGADMVVRGLEEFAMNNTGCMIDMCREDDAVVQKMVRVARNWDMITNSTNCLESSQLGGKFAYLDSQFNLEPGKVQSKQPITNTSHRVSKVLSQLHPGCSPIAPTVQLYDLDILDYNIQSLHGAFKALNGNVIHSAAIKSAPLSYLVHYVVQFGNMSVEAASLGEVKQALRCGCPPSKIIFDCPCKTRADIEFALSHHIAINANSYLEVEKIDQVVKMLVNKGLHSRSLIGLRVNPMVGAGSIEALSTATESSKFGVLTAYGTTEQYSELNSRVISTFQKYPFLHCVMCHVGSQGMTLESLANGVSRVMELADRIDEACGEKRITHIDIGGGLSANYDSDDVIPTFQEYVSQIMLKCKGYIERNPQRCYMTEFGKAIFAKAGCIASTVEDVLDFEQDSNGQVSIKTAILHTGADLMMRTCYRPDKFPHRAQLIDAFKQQLTAKVAAPLTESDSDLPNSLWSLIPSRERDPATVTFAGALCFSGDIIAKNLRDFPNPQPGDICLLLDTGANTLSLYSRHCSRLSPPVFVYREQLVHPATVQSQTNSPVQTFAVCCIREEETYDAMLSFWD